MRYLTLFAVTLLFTLGGRAEEVATPATALPYDHLDPVLLNEAAAAMVSTGELGTARILLERASRLAPHDARIARNLATLLAYRQGQGQGEKSGIATSDEQENQLRTLVGQISKLPPLWPARMEQQGGQEKGK